MKNFYRSFAGGEITPELYGRLELNKFQTGLKRCENAITLPHGPATRRPGTLFVAPTKFNGKRSRVIEFESGSESLAVEMGERYLRFHDAQGTVLNGPVGVIDSTLNLDDEVVLELAQDVSFYSRLVTPSLNFREIMYVSAWGVYVGACSGGVYTSEDGVAWLLRASGLDAWSLDMNPSNNAVVVAGRSSTSGSSPLRLATGTSATSWTVTSRDEVVVAPYVRFANHLSRFVITFGVSEGTTFITTPSGTGSFSVLTAPPGLGPLGYSPELQRLVAVGSRHGIYSCDDGINWTTRVAPVDPELLITTPLTFRAVEWVPGMGAPGTFLLPYRFFSSTTGFNYAMRYSTDGASFATTSSSTSSVFPYTRRGVVFNNALYSGNVGSLVRTTSPTTHEQLPASGVQGAIVSVAYNNNSPVFLAVNDITTNTRSYLGLVNNYQFSVGEWVRTVGVEDADGTWLRVKETATTPNTITLEYPDGSPYTAAAPLTLGQGAAVAAVVELETPYAEHDLFGINYAQSEDTVTLVHGAYPAAELNLSPQGVFTYTVVDATPDLPPPAGVGVAATVAVNQALSPHRYVVTAVAADGITESLKSAEVSVDNNLTLAGNYNTITWNAVGGAERYNVYKRQGVWAFIGQTDQLSLEDKNILPDNTKSPPDAFSDINTAPGKYPAATTFHEQRRWFGGQREAPQTVLASRPGTDNNFTFSVPTQADDALDFRLRARQRQQILHLAPLADLIALTPTSEWRIFSDGEPAIDPTSLSVKPQGYSGASFPQPALTSGSVLYVQAQGGRIRELSYNWESNSYRSIDASIMAPHLFDGARVTQLAYSRAPEQILWAVRDDGVLLGFTYVPEQQVSGWHQHRTAGVFESVAVVSRSSGDDIYFVVKREIDGQTVRYIERMPAGFFSACGCFGRGGELEEAYFLDCGLRYDGDPEQVFTGLDHLEGEEVHILADGAVEPPQVVADGSITLDTPASKVAVGLPYTTNIETLPAAFEGAPAAGQGMLKNAVAAHLRVNRSGPYLVGPSFDDMVSPPDRHVSDDYDSPPALRTEEERVQLPGSWDTDGTVCVRQDLPLPFTLVAMAVEYGRGD